MEIIVDKVVSLVWFALVLTRPLSELVLDVLYRIIFSKKTLPPILNKILLMSATTLAQKIRRREVSAVEAMNAYIGRIGGVQPAINACVDNRFEEALADARAVDAMLREGGKSEAELEAQLPLLGVPFSCKETIGVKNLAQTYALKSLKDRKAPEDSDTAALYRRAGAIPVVVTNVPTLALWWDTYSPSFGTTCNPYDTNRSAGGSSGGEGALIASAGSVIGIGNDLAGSIRLPASMCGIYGHKPSRGVISNKTHGPFGDAVTAIDPFLSTGPMCRYVEDLRLLVSILSGEERDRLRLNEEVNFRDVKVYYMEELPGFLLSATPDMKAAVRKAVKHFEDEYSISPEPLKMKEMSYAFEMWQCKLYESAGAFVRATLAGEGGKFNLWWEYLKSTLGFSDYDYRNLYFAAIEIQKSDGSYRKCLNMFEAVEKRLGDLLTGNAILILPVLPEHPPHSGLTIPKTKTIGYTAIFNSLGMPGTTVPAGFSKGLPIGLQVIAAQGNDRLTLAAAVELNKVFGGWQSPSPIIV